MALQDKFRGVDDVEDSVKNGLAVTVELCLPSLQEEATKLMGNKFSTGKFNN